MPEFICTGISTVGAPGRNIFYGCYPLECSRKEAIGQSVMFEGKEHRIKAVEWWCIPREPRRNEPVGFIFEDL